MSVDTTASAAPQSVHWSGHALDKWTNPRRNDVHDRDRDRGWRESVPVEYPSAYDDCRARYHPDGDCILIVTDDVVDGAYRPVVVTVINLRDRSAREQAYVRCQVRYGGEQA